MFEEAPSSFDCVSAPDEEFETELRAMVTDAYPVLKQRVEVAGFAEWHRRQSLEIDLAHHAIVLFMLHCRKNRQVPDDVLAYLVKIAKNLAARTLKGYLADKDAVAEAGVDPASVSSTLIYTEEELTEDENQAAVTDARLERVRVQIEGLPRRQREAIELYTKNPGATQRELGEKMGIGEDAFQKNLSRAIGRIRKCLIL